MSKFFLINFIKDSAIFFFDLVDKYIHQKNILDCLKKEKVHIETFCDVGSHKGKYTDLIINNYKVKKVILFEPQKSIFKYIKNKYKFNKKIKIFNYAASNVIGQKTFYINKHDLTSSLNKLNPKNKYLNIKSKIFKTTLNGMIEKKIKVKTVKLSNFFLKMKIQNIDFIKIDTEGHELEVLLGLGKKIKNIKSFLIEFHNGKTYLNYNSKKIEKILRNNNFILKGKIKFPFTTWEDRLYLNKDFNHI